MKHFFESLIKRAAEGSSLSSNERERMRAALREYARIKPIRSSEGGVPSPYLGTFRAYIMRPASAFMAVIFAVVAGSGGVAYASEGALPGDTLYPVKVGILEPARLALAADTEEKAALHREFAEARISEAAALAEQGRLTATVQTELATRFAENSQKGQEEADGATKVAFEARLAAYETVLEQVDKKGNGSSTLSIRSAIRGRLAIADQAEPPSAARAMLFTASLKEAAPARDEKEVEDLDVNADRAIKSSSETVNARTGKLGTTTTQRAKNELERATKLAEKGRELLKEGDSEGAYQALQESLNAATRVEIFTKAATTLNVNPFGTSTPTTATSSATSSPTTSSSTESSTEIRLRLRD